MNFKALMMFSDNFLLLFIIFLSPIITISVLGRVRKSAGLNLPPGPYSWPIVGNLLNMDAKQPHIEMISLAKTFGPLMSLRLGSKLMVIVSTPAAAKEVYRYHEKELSGRFKPNFMSIIPKVNDSTIALHDECDERWRFLRRISYTELFSTQSLESQSRIREEKAIKMVHFLNRKEGQVVNIVDIIFETFANMTCKIMVSRDVSQSWEKMGEMKHLFKKLVESASLGFSDLYPSLAMLDHFSMKKKFANYLEIVELLWHDVISERRNIVSQNKATQDRKLDFLDVLITNCWNDIEICNLLTEFLSSTESLTATVEWAMVELLRNQEALSKLRNDIEQLTKEGRGSLVEGFVNNLPYLKDCIKETLRLHPPSPLLVPRVALKACKLMDYDIPKDCLIITNAYALGRDPNTWEDPLSFKPERFQGNNVDLIGTNYGFLPFGGGRRVCAGYPLALKNIQSILALLVHTFDWSLPEGKDPSTLDMSEHFGVTLPKKHPLQLILKKRNVVNIV